MVLRCIILALFKQKLATLRIHLFSKSLRDQTRLITKLIVLLQKQINFCNA